jgi:hypothetical protein
MQAFESKDRVAAQVQQHADSYSRILACNLLAAGHQPPEWLIPSATLPQGACPNSSLTLPSPRWLFGRVPEPGRCGLCCSIGADFDSDLGSRSSTGRVGG